MKLNTWFAEIFATGRDGPMPVRRNRKIGRVRHIVVVSGLALIAAGCSGGGGGRGSGSGDPPTTPMTWDQGAWDQVTWN